MPRPTIIDTLAPTTPAKLARLEGWLGHPLPEDYRRFLLESNGGRPAPEAFGKKGGLRSMLSVFFSVGVRDTLYDLAAQFRKTRKEMPAAVLPIAFDVGGNKICLAIKGKNRGKVYFWDHEGGAAEEDPWLKFRHLIFPDKYKKATNTKRKLDWPGHPDLTLIADSFDEFLDSFHDIDDAELEAEAKAIHARNADFAAKRRAVLEELVSTTSDPDDKELLQSVLSSIDGPILGGPDEVQARADRRPAKPKARATTAVPRKQAATSKKRSAKTETAATRESRKKAMTKKPAAAKPKPAAPKRGPRGRRSK